MRTIIKDIISHFPLVMILFLSLFGGMIISMGMPSKFKVLSELLIYIFIVIALGTKAKSKFQIPHLWPVLVIFICIGFISLVINNTSSARMIFSFRVLFRFYCFYLAIIISDLNDDIIKLINIYILVLLVLQFPIVGVKFIKYGISERTAGAYAVHDGSIAATLPISLIFFLASYYFIYKSDIKFLLIGIGYIFCSIVGGKRAVFFLYPIQFFVIYKYIYSKNTNASYSRKIIFALSGIATLMIVSTIILSFNKTLNPEKEVGGKIDIGYALEYAHKYNTGIDAAGRSFGRISTTQRVIESLLNEGVLQLFFGMGPGYTTPSLLDSKKDRQLFQEEYEKLKVQYGWTTMNKICIEYGFFGVTLYTVMLFYLTMMCVSVYKQEIDLYWKAFASGAACFSFTMLFFAFTYHLTTFYGDTMPALYFYSMAVIYLRQKRFYENNMNKTKAISSSS